MRNLLVILMLACASSPAFAETKCTYVLKSERGRLEFSNLSTHSFPGDPDKVTVTRANGREKHCTYLLQDEGSYIECPGEDANFFTFVNNFNDDRDNADILNYDGKTWHRDLADCPPPQ